MSEINPYELFKFIQSDVTNEQLFEATDVAYKDVSEKETTPGNQKAWECSAGSLRDVYYVATAEEAKEEFEAEHGRKCTNVKDVSEGRLYKNLNNIDDPEEAIQSLKEDEEIVDEKKAKKSKNPDIADNPEIKTDNAGVTEEPEITKIQKEMNKQTPDVDKKSDAEVAKGKPSVKDQKNKKVEVTGVKTEEGKLPDNLNNVDNAEEYIQNLAEFDDGNRNNGEIIADGISDESVARDLALKNNGVAMKNPDTNLWSVKTKHQEQSSGSQGVVPASAARESVEEKCDCGDACECNKQEKMKDDEEDDEIGEAVVDEEKTTSDVAGQPEEGKTSHAQSDVSKSAARGAATDNPSADSQSTAVEDQVGKGVTNAQKMVQQSAAKTKATDKQTADANGPVNTTEMPKQTAGKVPYVKAAESKVDEDKMSDAGKASAQGIVNKSAARGRATDNPSADANASVNTTEPSAPSVGKTPEVDAEEPGSKGKSADAQMKGVGEGVDESGGDYEGKTCFDCGKTPCEKGSNFCKKCTKEVEKADEAVDVSVSTDDGDVNISSDGTTTTVTTSNSAAELPMDALAVDPMVGAPVDDLGPEIEPRLDDELFLTDEEQPEFSDEETLEMAEKLLVAEHLESMDEGCGKMSAKQKKFVEDMKAKKFSKKNKKKVADKKKEIK